VLELVTYFILPLITFVLGWELNKKLSDRPFLINEIYSPLYEEVNMMAKNISEFKDCYSTRYGRPDYSAPLPRNKIPGHVRKALILTGKYERVVKNLREKLEGYYNECEKYNLLLNDARAKVKEIIREEVQKIRTESDDRIWRQNILKKLQATHGSHIASPGGTSFPLEMYLKNKLPIIPQLKEDQYFFFESNYNGWDAKITKEDLERNSLSLEEFLKRILQRINKENAVIKLREKQEDLRNPKELLDELKDRIKNPSPLFDRKK